MKIFGGDTDLVAGQYPALSRADLHVFKLVVAVAGERTPFLGAGSVSLRHPGGVCGAFGGVCDAAQHSAVEQRALAALHS